MTSHDPAPLTRHEARALETRAATTSRRPQRADTAPPRDLGPRRAHPTRPAPRHRRSPLAKRLGSLGALLTAGALAFGMSVPANALLGPEALVPKTPEAAASLAASGVQSLEVSDSVAHPGLERDQFGTLSYAEVLRLTYSQPEFTFTASTGSIRWPFPYTTTISSGWGDRDDGFHKGVDFTPGIGAPIYAIADGVATVAQDFGGDYGTYVVLVHSINGQRVESLYAHMLEGSTPIVVGEEVKVGDFLGLVGSTGRSTGPHLHLEIHVDGVPVDPYPWLSANVN